MEFIHEITLRDGSVLETDMNIAITMSTLKKLKNHVCKDEGRCSPACPLSVSIQWEDGNMECGIKNVINYLTEGDLWYR